MIVEEEVPCSCPVCKEPFNSFDRLAQHLSETHLKYLSSETITVIGSGGSPLYFGSRYGCACKDRFNSLHDFGTHLSLYDDLGVHLAAALIGEGLEDKSPRVKFTV